MMAHELLAKTAATKMDQCLSRVELLVPFSVPSSRGVLPSSCTIKLNDVKPSEGSMWCFMVTRGFQLSRGN